ncbi:MAG: hypothetical protein ACK4R7_06140 [Fervidobacterium sp.]
MKKENNMFCYQCEQAKGGVGCDTMGICGKDTETALLQDLLIYQVKGISYLENTLRKKGIRNNDVDK